MHPTRIPFPKFRFRRATALPLTLVGLATLPGFASPRSAFPSGEGAGFRVVARIKVGKNPHQIAFTPDGQTAYVAAAGSDRVTRVDVSSRRVLSALDVRCVPLGVAVPPSGSELLVGLFGRQPRPFGH